MDKVSVIIPTIQKNTKVLAKLANSLSADEVVDEILIINNIEKELKTNIPKVKILQQEKNLYVNASWNLGISCIKNNIFLIINDDILPCPNYCSIICNSGILNREDTGLVGINNAFINQMPKDTEDLQEPERRNFVYFKELKNHFGTGDWGSAFFGKKENYYKIPDDIRIIYGDNYLLYNNKKNKKINYSICNLEFNHIHSLSSASSEFRKIVASDIASYKKYFD